jgi:hypothetical protein
MDIKNIVKKTLTIAVLISSVTLSSCSGKLYTGNTTQEDGAFPKYKTKDRVNEDQSIPSPYTEKYRAKLMEK